MISEKYLNIILSVAMLILLAAAVIPLLPQSSHLWYDWGRIIFAFGAVSVATVRILQRLTRRRAKFSLRVRRLFTLEFWSSMCYLLAALFTYADAYHSTWLGFLTAGACVQVYASFMIDRQLRKDSNDKNTK